MATNNLQSMCDGFNKVFYCINNEPFVIVEAEYREEMNWYVPKFLTLVNWKEYGYNQSHVYSIYPQDGNRMEQFCKFYESVDSKIREIVLMKIMESYNGESKLPVM